MNRTDAERVFALVAELGGDLRGTIVSERWWLVWILAGPHMLVGCLILQAMSTSGETPPLVLVAALAAFALNLLLLIQLVHRRAGGQRTATESYLRWIWCSHILCTLLVPLLEALMGLPAFTLGPVFALLAAFAFSIMAMITERLFLVLAVFFAGVAAAMSWLGDYQFLIYGVGWFVVMESLGSYYHYRTIAHIGRRL